MDATCSQSETISVRIAETNGQIAALEAELDCIPPQKETLLAQKEIDQPALDTLEAHEERQVRTLLNLRQRGVLLARQQEEAEVAEAGERVIAIAARMQDLAREEATAAATFRKTEAALTRAVERLAALHGEAGNITEEQEFLHARYGAPRQDFADFGKLPSRENSSALIFKSLHRFWLRAEFSRGDWVRKLEQWENAQYKLAQKCT